MQRNSPKPHAGTLSKGKNEVIEVLHITDCHLSATADADLLGVNTRDSLRAVLDQAEADSVSPDLLLLTGDLAQDGSVKAYEAVQNALAGFSCPQFWFPGNHDSRVNMAKAIKQPSMLEKVVRVGNWQIILLDSLVEGKVHGYLEADELSVLEKALEEGSDYHTLVCLHHHPVDIDSAWLDKIGLHNRDDFWQIIDQADNVRAVLWGHIHQHWEGARDKVSLMATPSTCIQFLPASDDFGVEDIAPGYRYLSLHPDGRIESRVERAEQFEFNVDMASNGY